ncbi:MAG: hypothetical protein ACK55I_02705, partial [bacterium]
MISAALPSGGPGSTYLSTPARVIRPERSARRQASGDQDDRSGRLAALEVLVATHRVLERVFGRRLDLADAVGDA